MSRKPLFPIKTETAEPPKHKSKYPFDALELNNYFIIPEKRRKTVAPAAHFWAKHSGKKFSIKKVSGEVRVYRIE